MPVRKVKGGYKWGKSGQSLLKTKKQAEAQGRAIYCFWIQKEWQEKEKALKRNQCQQILSCMQELKHRQKENLKFIQVHMQTDG